MNTTNYNSEVFNDKNNDISKANNTNMTEFNSSGKCNGCAHFNFGARKCNLKQKSLSLTITSETAKGNFVSFIKPSNCTDFKKKYPKVDKKTDNKTEKKVDKKQST